MKHYVDPVWYGCLWLGVTLRVFNVQHLVYYHRDTRLTSLPSGGGPWSICRTRVTQQFILEVGGVVNKPRPQVLIYPGEPWVPLGFGRDGRVAMVVVL